MIKCVEFHILFLLVKRHGRVAVTLKYFDPERMNV